MVLLVFLLGFICGIVAVFFIVFFVVFRSPNAYKDDDPGFKEQFVPFQIPIELKQLLISPGAVGELKKRETCIGLNVLLHFIYQEFRSTVRFRRWALKKLQMEFNDLTSRTATGKLLQDVRIRDLTLGSQFPVIKRINVEKAQLSDDTEMFEEVDIIMDVEYRGGLCVSVDVFTVLGRQAFLSVQVSRIAGQARLRLSRHPFTHFSFAFLEMPQIDFKVESRFLGGRPLKQLIPLIIQQIRRVIQRKHVLPNLKIRYRPLFPNPLLQPSSNPADFDHIDVRGGLEVIVRSCSRLNVSSVPVNLTDVYCAISIAPKPYFYGSTNSATIHFVSIAIKLVRRTNADPIGLILSKLPVPEKGNTRSIVVQEVSSNSDAERAGFKQGDILLAVNNQPIRLDRYAVSRLLAKVTGEVTVLVERNLANIEDEDDIAEQMVTRPTDFDSPLKVEEDGDFVNVDFVTPNSTNSTPSGLTRAHSLTDLKAFTSDSETAENVIEEKLNLPLPSEKLRRTHSDTCLGSRSNSTEENATPTSEVVTDCATNPMLNPNSASLVSKRQQLREKAAETATNVAQKLLYGKATVKDLWYKHKRTPSIQSGNANNQVEMATECEMEGSEVGGSRPVSWNVDVEPDTVSNSSSDAKQDVPEINVIDKGQVSKERKDEQTPELKRKNKKLNKKLNISTCQSKSKPSQERKTDFLPLKENLSFNQSLLFNLDKKWRYINVTVWAGCEQKSSTSAEPILLGYTSLYVPEILDDCSVTVSNYHEQSFTLRPPGQANVPSRYAKFIRYAGFDARLCYGDITLGFLWMPQGLPDTVSLSTVTSDGSAPDVTSPLNIEINQKLPGHNWTQASFTQAVLCAHCKGKIWLKTASQCTKCSVICHNKCMSKATQLQCSDLPTPTGSQKLGFEILEPESETKQIGEEQVVDELPSKHTRVGSTRRERIKKLFPYLRKRKPPSDVAAQEEQKDLPIDSGMDVYPADEAIERTDEVPCTENNTEWDTSGDVDVEESTSTEQATTDQHYHTMLYTHGGTYNEHVINAAKDLGRDLFCDLTAEDRKVKINEQIDKLHQEIDEITKERLKALQNCQAAEDPEEKSELETEFNRIDDRLQALAVLMLHYCAGLQNCIDLEDVPVTVTEDTVTHGDDTVTENVENQCGTENVAAAEL